ncbi:hypothetical protein [Clostridium porci]|uniref:hypothetical protein n=1 Tax=Clostridium porci TaxID=2605778 RepID=UPI0018A6B337|nr:hypothetical protein [Clostridium porci]
MERAKLPEIEYHRTALWTKRNEQLIESGFQSEKDADIRQIDYNKRRKKTCADSEAEFY